MQAAFLIDVLTAEHFSNDLVRPRYGTDPVQRWCVNFCGKALTQAQKDFEGSGLQDSLLLEQVRSLFRDARWGDDFGRGDKGSGRLSLRAGV